MCFTITGAAAANTDDDTEWEVPDKEYLEKIKKAMEVGARESLKMIEEIREGWKSIPLNVAVIGNSGVGKSSFINAIRRLTADDEGGAVENISLSSDIFH